MSLLLQAVEVANSSEATQGGKDLSLLQLVANGGVIMIPLAILSLLAVYLIIERFMYISKASKIKEQDLLLLKDKLKSGNVNDARSLCKSTPTAWGRVFGNGVNMIGQPMKDIEQRVEDTAQVELSRMEKNMTYLNLIAGLAPLLGFVGTIIGVIKIFYEIAATADISIGTISEGLYVKMVSSASGLLVGIIAFTGYHILNNKIDRFASRIQEHSLAFKSVLLNVEE